MPVDLLPHDKYDRVLLDHVRPTGWADPEPKANYDLVAIGAGAAGLVSAVGAAGLGARVALVEKHLLGGDCLTAGCVPSKALLRCARAAAEVKRAGEFGVRVTGSEVDFPVVMERMRSLRAAIAPHDSAEHFRALGIDVFLGEGRFTGPDVLEVNGKRLKFRRAVVATGTRPAIPDVPGLVEAGFLTNESIFALTELPTQLAVIGGGPIGCELGQAFARFGSRVTLFAKGAKVLPKEDPEAAAHVADALRRDGVTIVDAAIDRIDAGTNVVHHAGGEMAFDRILVATGRLPNVAGLGLEAAGVSFDENRGVLTDDHLRTTSKRIYAAGDVATDKRFTHAADAMARLVIRNALFWGRSRFSRLVIPRCTYTEPELASVGMSAEDAAKAQLRFRTITQPFSTIDRAVIDGESDGFVTVRIAEWRDRILGATAVGPRANEIISEVAVAMTNGVGLGRLTRTIHAYPSAGEAIRKIGDTYNRTRLTPLTKWFLQLLLRR